MKLQIMIKDGALLLCDEHGTPFPCQRSVTVRNEVGDVAKVVVEFILDGERCRLIGAS